MSAGGFSSWLYSVNTAFNTFVWGVPMLLLFLLAGLFFTVKTRGLQFRRLCKIIASPFSGSGGGGLSSFAALSGALAGTLGIGNIVGVAGAIMLGGRGSIFWMIISAFFCMILKYAETFLAMRYREKAPGGGFRGGPMYYMRDGLGLWSLSAVFSVLCIITAIFGAGNVTQIGTVAQSLNETFSLPPLLVSGVCAVLVLLMTGGGEKRLGRLFSFLTPFMSALFLAVCLFIIFKNLSAVPEVLRSIVRDAFSVKAASGGAMGYTFMSAVKYGVARGVFSNEAGLGSSPIIHASSGNGETEQAMCGAFEVFFDTVVMAGITAVAILASGVPLNADSATALCASAIGSILPRGGAILSIMIALFAISSVPCWYYYGERCVEYLFRDRFKKAYRAIFLLATFLCPIIAFDGMWELADTLNGLMAVPNLIAVFMLWRVVAEGSE